MKVKYSSVEPRNWGKHGRFDRFPLLDFCLCEFELSRWDPKGGDLCLRRVKAEEIPVEVRCDSDVQIDRLMWV